MSTYVTATGFVRQTLQEIRTVLETALKQVYGSTFETAVDSPNGLLISLFSLDASALQELAEEIYAAHDPRQATGYSLEILAALRGLSRKAAANCIAPCVCYTDGSSAITIPADSQVVRTRGSQTFTALSGGTISTAAFRDITLAWSGTGYSLTLEMDFGTFSVTGSSLSGAYSLLADALNDSDDFGGTAIASATSIRIIWATSDMALKDTTSWTISQVGSSIDFTCDVSGAEYAAAGEITEIGTSVSGWVAVENLIDATIGTAKETDAALRARLFSTTAYTSGRGTDLTLRAHLLDDVDGVTAVTVVSNRALLVDSRGRPAKSVECTVIGGTDREVAACIWKTVCNGIQSWGNTSVDVTDENGDTQLIQFSRVTAKFLWVQVTYKKYDEETFPDDGADLIKQAILTWAASEFLMGKDVIPGRFNTPIYTVPGVGQVTVEVALTSALSDTPSYGTAVISVGDAYYAALAESRITLVEAT